MMTIASRLACRNTGSYLCLSGRDIQFTFRTGGESEWGVVSTGVAEVSSAKPAVQVIRRQLAEKSSATLVRCDLSILSPNGTGDLRSSPRGPVGRPATARATGHRARDWPQGGRPVSTREISHSLEDRPSAVSGSALRNAPLALYRPSVRRTNASMVLYLFSPFQSVESFPLRGGVFTRIIHDFV